MTSEKREKITQTVIERTRQQIEESVSSTYPDHQFAHLDHDATDSVTPLWLINPLDGATNYMRNVPHFAISVAVKHGDKIQHAVIYDPLKQDLFTTSRGEGARLNNRRIRISSTNTLTDAILAANNTKSITDNNQRQACRASEF